jgi:uncharacterized protein (UPF0333 family)
MKSLLELAILVAAVTVAAHWGTFGFASSVDLDEYKKTGSGIPTTALVLAAYAAWSKRHKNEEP